MKKILFSIFTAVVAAATSLTFFPAQTYAESAPGAPALTITKSTSNGYIRLKWEAVDGASLYKVYVREPDDKSYDCEKSLTQCEFKYYPEDSGTYKFKVAACSGLKSTMSSAKKCSFTFDFADTVLNLNEINSEKDVKNFVKNYTSSVYSYENSNIYYVSGYKSMGEDCDLIFVCDTSGNISRSLLWGSNSKNDAELIRDRCENHCEKSFEMNYDMDDLYDALGDYFNNASAASFIRDYDDDYDDDDDDDDDYDDDDYDDYDYDDFKEFFNSSKDSFSAIFLKYGIEGEEMYISNTDAAFIFSIRNSGDTSDEDASLNEILKSIKSKYKNSALNSKYIAVYSSFPYESDAMAEYFGE